VKAGRAKILYVLFVTATYARFLEGVKWYLFKSEIIYEIFSPQVSVILVELLLTAVTIPFILLFIVKVFRPFMGCTDSPVWKYMWVIPAFTCALMYAVWFLCTDGQVVIGFLAFFLFIMVLMEIASVFIYCIAFKIVIQTGSVARLEERNVMTAQQLDLQQKYYKHLLANIDEAKRARHDLRHHLNVLQMYVSSGEIQKIADYIAEYKKSLPVEGVWDDSL